MAIRMAAFVTAITKKQQFLIISFSTYLAVLQYREITSDKYVLKICHVINSILVALEEINNCLEKLYSESVDLWAIYTYDRALEINVQTCSTSFLSSFPSLPFLYSLHYSQNSHLGICCCFRSASHIITFLHWRHFHEEINMKPTCRPQCVKIAHAGFSIHEHTHSKTCWLWLWSTCTCSKKKKSVRLSHVIINI